MPEVLPAGATERLPLHRIEAELTRVLHSGQSPDDPAAQRARMSNLVVFCDDARRQAEVEAALPGIIALHPARVLLAVHEPTSQDHPVMGTVQAWCTLAGTRICSEQVTLYSHDPSVESLLFALRGLVIGDLPTNLWWASRTPPALAGPVVYEAGRHVQQILYDSNGWPDPARGVAATAAWSGASIRAAQQGVGRRVVSDVNWRRLKFWRRILTQALDPNVLPGALESITEIELEHGPHAVVQAWLLLSWLASRLNWVVEAGRVEEKPALVWQARTPRGAVRARIARLPEGPSAVRRLRLRCLVEGKPGALIVAAENESRLVAILEGRDTAPRTLTLQPQPLDELIARQLSDRDRDPVFQEALNVAEVFARSVL